MFLQWEGVESNIISMSTVTLKNTAVLNHSAKYEWVDVASCCVCRVYESLISPVFT